MPFFDPIRIGASGVSDTAFTVNRSARYSRPDNHYFSKQPSSAGNRRTFTISTWVKRSNQDVNGALFYAGTSVGQNHDDTDSFIFNGSNQINFVGEESQTVKYDLVTTRFFRDPAAWYHIVLAVDTTQGTASNRIKLYVNGVQETSFATETYPSQNYELFVNSTVSGGFTSGNIHVVGYTGGGRGLDGYLAEFHLIDGQQLTPSSFAETNSDTGQWVPIDTSGLTFGTNGFRLKFDDNSGTTATTLGKDSSGNGNNFTPANFGTGDAVKDTPTNNFCTFLSIQKTAGTTFSEGNLKGVNDTEHKTFYGNFGLRSGKWYWEAVAVSGSATKYTYGVSDIKNTINTQVDGTNYLLANSSATYAYGDAVSIYRDDLYKNGSVVTNSYQTTPSAGDIIGIALDVDAGKVWFARNGTWINGSATASTTLNESSHDTTVATGEVYTPAYSAENVGWQANFGQDSSFSNAKTAQGNTDGSGQGDFYYAVPSGFKAICSANLPDPSILLPNIYFDVLLWSGNGSSRNITGLQFDPDWVWAKNRTIAYSPEVYDTVRGDNKRIFPDSGNAEVSNGGLSFGVTGGFALTGGGSLNDDDGTNDIVAWNWNAGGSTATNSNGTISSQVRASTTSGVSIVTYTGNGTGGATVGHGLGVAPEIVLIKRRNASDDWRMNIGPLLGSGKEGHSVKFNSTGGESDANNLFNSTNPTSTVFTIGTDADVNGNTSTYVAYCFSGVSSFSKFDTYVGNGSSDGTFVFTGFKPAYVLMKNTTTGSTNFVKKTLAISLFNRADEAIKANTNNVEESALGSIDFLSNGFKLRNAGGTTNSSGDNYIYWAFADSPFKNSRAV